MRWMLCFWFGCLAFVGTAHGQGINGNDLHDYCRAALEKESQSGARAGLCVGFLDAYRQVGMMLPEAGLACFPAPGVGQEQYIKILVKYFDQHPERLHLPAAQLVYDATQEAFPCPKASRPSGAADPAAPK